MPGLKVKGHWSRSGVGVRTSKDGNAVGLTTVLDWIGGSLFSNARPYQWKHDQSTTRTVYRHF